MAQNVQGLLPPVWSNGGRVGGNEQGTAKLEGASETGGSVRSDG